MSLYRRECLIQQVNIGQIIIIMLNYYVLLPILQTLAGYLQSHKHGYRHDLPGVPASIGRLGYPLRLNLGIC